MWSHYADHHRGFCIEYDLESLGDSNHFFRKNLYPVLYSADLYDLSPFVEGLAVKGGIKADHMGGVKVDQSNW
jgi:hypothetical protein